jgi:uncharacterized protein YbjT (DUF2867 family)
MDARFVEQVDERTHLMEYHMTTMTRASFDATDLVMPGPVLIAGGTGKTGRRVAARLQALGVPVRIGSRSSDPPFDWERPEGWATALQGASAVYATYAPDTAVPGAVQAIEQLVALAEQMGIEQFVLLSGRGEAEAQAAEAVVQRSTLDWTIVRCAWFMQNFSESYLIDGVLAGELFLPVGDVGEPFIDTDDIADVVTAALTEPRHANQLYELTGPRTLTLAEAMREIGEAVGRELTYTQLSSEEFSAAMRAEGLPEDVIWLLDYLFSTVMDGRNAYLTDGVQRALGRPPRDFRDYARDVAASGAWDLPA